MNNQQFIDEMTKIQENILNFLSNEGDSDKNLQNLINLFDEFQIHDNKHKINSLLHLLSKILNNNHESTFLNKIEQIMKFLKEDIIKYFTNFEIFRIFQKNKLILLLLIEEKIITMDNYIVNAMTKPNYIKFQYHQFFSPEIKPFINDDWSQQNLIDEINKDVPINFFELRKKGENESFLCQLIRKDSITDFIVYINKENISLDSIIKSSIYETNYFLLKNENVSLIEYAAFYGSIRIFSYLQKNQVKYTSSLWSFAIRGGNAEIIKILEENNSTLKKEYIELFYESIECHHNNIANYFLSNYLQNEEKDSLKTFIQSLKSYNFAFIQYKCIDQYSFLYLCKYDYYILAEIYLRNNNNIGLNTIVI